MGTQATLHGLRVLGLALIAGLVVFAYPKSGRSAEQQTRDRQDVATA